MGIFRTFLLISALMVRSTVGGAGELPKEILLQCHGKTKMFLMEGDKTTDVKFDNFEALQLRLKDRTIVNIQVNVTYGKDCNLDDGKIWCELNETIYNRETDSTEKRHLLTSLIKETGELNLSIETWTFHGKTLGGKPWLSSRVQRTGVCQTVGKPLF